MDFMNLMKSLIKEEIERRQILLETPKREDIDKLLTEKISRILNREKKLCIYGPKGIKEIIPIFLSIKFSFNILNWFHFI